MPGRRAPSLGWRRDGSVVVAERTLAEEVPVAFAYRGTTYAVMMATPSDLQDFAFGFSLTEGVIGVPSDIEEMHILRGKSGIVLDITLTPALMDSFWKRRRYLAGPSGCGLCGIDSIAQAMRPCRPVEAEPRFTPADIADALTALPRQQVLNRETRAIHAAAFWQPDAGIVALREDVGRHNALDKLIGALAREETNACEGMILLTSRISVEMVQKAAAARAAVIVAISAPTALAVSVAEAAGITLVGIARDDGFEVLTHPRRVASLRILPEPACEMEPARL